MQTAAKTQPEESAEPIPRNAVAEELLPSSDEEILLPRLRLLWSRRAFLAKAATAGFLAGTLFAFLIPKSYVASTQLMPPDTQSSSGMAMLAAFAAKSGGGLGGVAGDLLGVKS
jgi:hypothetical protein